MDWSATGSMMSGIGALIGVGAVIYAANKAANTFDLWHRQKHHERSMEVSEDVLTLAYKIKAEIRSLRSFALFEYEKSQITGRLRDQGLINDLTTDVMREALITAQSILDRILSNKDLFESIHEKKPVAKAVLGDEVAEGLQAFWNEIVKVRVAATSYADVAGRRPFLHEEAEQRRLERLKRYEALIWEGGGDEEVDAVNVTINQTISELEKILLPIIRNK